MTTKQISVFLENKTGRLNEVTKALAAHDINMQAFCIAETTDFGLMRLIVQDADHTAAVLRDAGFWDFIIKLVMVLLSLAAGFQGGEVVPLLVLGATFTSSLASLFSLDSAAYAILGAIGFLSAGTKLPFVTFALGMELFGYTEPALLFLMTSISLLSSGKTGIYSHQRIY